jgi:hypothetical protein
MITALGLLAVGSVYYFTGTVDYVACFPPVLTKQSHHTLQRQLARVVV